jgi:UDP-galactopyranose mutase
MAYDYLIVGSGLSGASMAFFLRSSNKKVLMVESRESVGGNIATKVEDGITVHLYGPHIFHTSDEFAWGFVNEHCEMYPFINSPLANYKGEIYHLPFNMNTFRELWGVTTPEEAKAKIAEEVAKENIKNPQNLEEQALMLVGRTIFEKLIKGYSEKQWGRNCRDLPASIIKRIPLRFAYDNNYFDDLYQGLPKGGYSVLIENLLKGIEVKTNTDFLLHRKELEALASHVIYTGPIDAYFGYEQGRLEYRSLRFEAKELPADDFQHNPVVNFTSSDVPYTRICEHKGFDPSCYNRSSTIVTYEYPEAFAEGRNPCYPINDEKNAKLAASYLEKAQALEPKAYFLGRLATYRYCDMDDAIVEAKRLFERLEK